MNKKEDVKNHENLVKKKIGPINEEDFKYFMYVSKARNLDPLLNQIYCIPLQGKKVPITSIDGLRLLAERTGKYAPGRAPEFQYDSEGNLICVTAYVKKQTTDGTWHETSAQAFWKEYKSTKIIWTRLPHVMLAKCAESQALRKAFPGELSGVYSEEEMSQANEIEDSQIEANISKEQGKEIKLLLKKLNGDTLKKLLDWKEVNNIGELLASDYLQIIKVLKSKILKETKSG